MPIVGIKLEKGLDLRHAPGSTIEPSVGALRAAGDLEDDDQAVGLANGVDDPRLADAKAPEAAPGQLDRAGPSRIGR